MKFSHDSLNELFLLLDKDSEIKKYEFCGWLVWPIIKERLWHTLLQNSCGQEKKSKIPIKVLLFLLFGLYELVINILFPKKKSLAVAHLPKTFITKDGIEANSMFGSLLHKDVLEISYEPATKARFFFKPGKIHEAFSGLLFRVISLFFVSSPLSKRLSGCLCHRLSLYYPEFASLKFDKIIRRSLALFYVKNYFFELIFKRAQVKKLIIQDPDAKCGEVAAAKKNNVVVIEMQHGMFSCKEPDYSWGSDYLPCKSSMVVPEKIMVFGKLWKTMLIKNKFWKEADVTIVDYPILSHYRKMKKYAATTKNKKEDGKLNILFPSQYYIQTEASCFFADFFEMQKQANKQDINVVIKLHPSERNIVLYEELTRKYSDMCSIVGSDENIFDLLIKDFDCVVGYTSMVLLEALGLGIPVVSLKGPSAIGGLLGVFGLDNLSNIVRQFSEPQELNNYLENYRMEKTPWTENESFFWNEVYGESEMDLETIFQE